MMSVFEYAEDVNKTVEYILKKAKELNIDVENEDDILSEDDIIILDNAIDDDSEELEDHIEEIADEIIKKEKIETGHSANKVKIKKKTEQSVNVKKELANKKKQMYKNKEKLMSNTPAVDDNVVLYKENMTISDLANALNVNGAEIIKKLFGLGIMATLNNAISFENAEILVLDYNKELERE